MGISLKLTGASFRRPAVSFFLPNRDRLVYEFVFGGDFAKTRVNLVDGKDTLAQIGTPTYNAKSVLISSGSGNQHGFSGVRFPGQDFTIFQIRKKPSVLEGASVFGSPDGSLSIGFINNHGSGTLLDFWNTRGVSADTPTLAMPTHNDFFLQAGVGPDLGLGKLFLGSGGVVTSATAPQPGTARFPTALIIGGGTGCFGSQEISWTALFNRLFSDSEVEDVYDQAKIGMNNLIGITMS